jgi:chemotaxis family two-component system response regulator Rcp1
MKQVFLIEDNEGDILLTNIILKDIDPDIQIEVAKDGAEAIATLELIKIKRTGSRPALILLDVNLPKKNGFEVLSYIRANDFWENIPVVMLTTTSIPNDRMKAFENKADSFLTKSSDLAELQDTFSSIYDKWLKP